MTTALWIIIPATLFVFACIFTIGIQNAYGGEDAGAAGNFNPNALLDTSQVIAGD